LLGLAAASGRLGGGLGGALLASTGLLSAGLVAFVVLQQRGVFSRVVGLAARLSTRAAGWAPAAASLDAALGRFYRERRRDFALSIGFFFLGWLAGVPEVVLMLGSMGP